MKKLLYVIAVVSLLLNACKNDPPDFTGFEEATLNTGDTYQPVTAGTYWRYASSGIGQDADSSLTTMQGNATVFNGKPYQTASTKAASDSTAGNIYFLHDGNSYYEKEVISGETTDVLYLKTGVGVGGTWDALYGSSGTDSKSVGKLVETNITRTIFGKTYKNVIHTNVTVQSNDGSGKFITVLTLDFYIAKNIGIIEANADLLGNVVSSKLYKYEIK